MAALLVASLAAAAAPARPTAPPSSETAVEAWLAADSWIRSNGVPSAGSGNAAVPLEDVEAVSLTLRLGGRVVAIGEDDAGGPEMLRRATGRLLAEFATGLRSNWPEAVWEDLRDEALLEMELAGASEPLLGATFADAAASVDPGVHGLAVRRGDRWSRAWPGRLLASGLAGDPASTLRRLATDIGLPRGATLRELLALDSIGLYRTPVVRLAQFEPGGLPEMVRRGDRAASPRPMDAAAARDLAERLLGHLQGRLHEDRRRNDGDGSAPPLGLGLRGDFDPISGRSDPFAAPPLPQALAILAATRLAAAEDDLAPTASAFARRLARDLAIVDAIETPPTDAPESLAALAIAASLDPTLAEASSEVSGLFATAARVVRDRTRGADFAELSPGRQAIFAAAAATLATGSAPRVVDAGDGRGGADSQADAAARLREAWEAAEPSARIGLMPWYAWAASRLPEGGGLAPDLAAFESRLAGLRIESDDDLAGGFDFEQAMLPRADARSVLPGLGTALLLSDSDLVPRTPDPEHLDRLRRTIASQRRSLEFLRRLSISEEAAARLPHGGPAVGGVRDAPWDVRQSTMVQAIALWWLAERLDSDLP